MAKSIKSSAELRELSAYTLIHEEYLDDIKSAGLIFRHKKSGARICVLSNSDENKVFCAGFRTTPENSTGVPHIIEHSVLNGSKISHRDPFMQLAKGSLNTFLNAMTYPTKQYILLQAVTILTSKPYAFTSTLFSTRTFTSAARYSCRRAGIMSLNQLTASLLSTVSFTVK